LQPKAAITPTSSQSMPSVRYRAAHPGSSCSRSSTLRLVFLRMNVSLPATLNIGRSASTSRWRAARSSPASLSQIAS
jgi:hypothetical protein